LRRSPSTPWRRGPRRTATWPARRPIHRQGTLRPPALQRRRAPSPASLRRRRTATLREQDGGVLPPEERVVAVPHEAGAQLHGAAGGPAAEGREPGDGGVDAAGADGGREVGAALVEPGQRGVGGSSEVGVGGVGSTVGDGGEHGVHAGRVPGARVVAPLQAPGVHERRGVVVAGGRAKQEEQQQEDVDECFSCRGEPGHAYSTPRRVESSDASERALWCDVSHENGRSFF
jgi:hypothetical protein